jgi:hypothetical protein
MDKLTALKTALNEILDDDRVHRMDDGGYEVIISGGSVRYVRRTDHLNDAGDWTAYTYTHGRFRQLLEAPLSTRPNEIAAWALLG